MPEGLIKSPKVPIENENLLSVHPCFLTVQRLERFTPVLSAVPGLSRDRGTYKNLWRILHADNAFKMLRNYRLKGVLFQDAINSIILNFWCCSSLLYALVLLVSESIILAF